ncbi:hypothetical protein MASR2M66_29580 [Chloroflexota bacterium]
MGRRLRDFAQQRISLLPMTQHFLDKFADVIHLSTTRTADPASAGIDRPAKRREQVIFIDAVNEVTRERSMSYLKPEHQQRIADAYHAFKDVEGFAKVASLADIRANDGKLSIPLYVRGKAVRDDKGEYAVDDLKVLISEWEESSAHLTHSVDDLFQQFGQLTGKNDSKK